MYDKENAVFSVKLGAIEAEIIHKLLKNKLTGENVSDAKNSSQLAVMYDLTYKGVEPAHNVEITVNFNAVDEYKNHKFKFDSEFNFSNKDNKTDSDPKEDGDGYNIKVIADADVDVMLRELTNNGSIIIKQTNYKDGEDSILGPNDPTGMELVKRLLSAELFTPVPIPYESYSALKKTQKVQILHPVMRSQTMEKSQTLKKANLLKPRVRKVKLKPLRRKKLILLHQLKME